MCVNARWRISGRAEVWNGESMTLACSAAPNGFSVRVIVRICFHRGFQRSMGSKRSLARAVKPLMLVAVTAQAPFCSPRRSPNHSLETSTSTMTRILKLRRREMRYFLIWDGITVSARAHFIGLALFI